MTPRFMITLLRKSSIRSTLLEDPSNVPSCVLSHLSFQFPYWYAHMFSLEVLDFEVLGYHILIRKLIPLVPINSYDITIHSA